MDSREGGGTVMRKVAVNLPGTTEICRAFDQHGRWPECLQQRGTLDKLSYVSLQLLVGEGHRMKLFSLFTLKVMIK